jgi:hypothetical protein
MVDEDGGPGQGGFGGADEGGQEDRLFVQRAVEPPPDALQDLPEVARMGGRTGHAAGESAVEMRVRVHEPGHDQPAVQVETSSSGCGARPAAALHDAVAADPEVGRGHRRRVQRGQGRVAQQHGTTRF